MRTVNNETFQEDSGDYLLEAARFDLREEV